MCGYFLQSWEVSAGKPIKPAEESNDYKALLPSEVTSRIFQLDRTAKNMEILVAHLLTFNVYMHIYLYIYVSIYMHCCPFKYIKITYICVYNNKKKKSYFLGDFLFKLKISGFQLIQVMSEAGQV